MKWHRIGCIVVTGAEHLSRTKVCNKLLRFLERYREASKKGWLVILQVSDAAYISLINQIVRRYFRSVCESNVYYEWGVMRYIMLTSNCSACSFTKRVDRDIKMSLKESFSQREILRPHVAFSGSRIVLHSSVLTPREFLYRRDILSVAWLFYYNLTKQNWWRYFIRSVCMRGEPHITTTNLVACACGGLWRQKWSSHNAS